MSYLIGVSFFSRRAVLFLFVCLFVCLFVFCFLGPYPHLVEVPRLGV